MQIAINGDELLIKDPSSAERQVVSKLKSFTFDRKGKYWHGIVSVKTIEELQRIVSLPPSVKAKHEELVHRRNRFEAERDSKAPHPMVKYPIKGATLFAHQVQCANMALCMFGWDTQEESQGPVSRGYAVWGEMGLGKSLISVTIMGAGYQLGHLHRVLIVAPSSVVPVWPQEIDKFADYPTEVAMLTGAKSRRLKLLKQLQEAPEERLKVAVINIEAVWRDGLYEALEAFSADLIICDESQRIKGEKTAQSLAMHALADEAPYRIALSGTPIQNEITDLWSQYRFLDRSVFGDNFYTFRGRYCQMGGFNRKQIVGRRNLEELVALEYSIAIRKTKEECLDLPDQTFIEHPVILSEKERKLYDKMRRDSIAELESGGEVTATTVLTKILRMQQITGGFLPDDESGKPKPIGTAKLDALRDLMDDYLADPKKKLVIFARFLAEVHAILDLCKKAGSDDWQTVTIYGDVSKEDRAAAVDAFQTDPKVRVIVGQLDTMAVGLTLTAADTCIYYSVSYSLGTYSQSLSRIHRIGQVNKCTYIHLLAEKTIDSEVMKALSRKEDLAKSVVDNWREILGKE